MSESYVAAALRRTDDVLRLPEGYGAVISEMHPIVRSLVMENTDPMLTTVDDLLTALEMNGGTQAWASNLPTHGLHSEPSVLDAEQCQVLRNVRH